MASWLVRLSPNWAVWVQALARDTVVFLVKTLNSDSVSLHPGVQMGTNEFFGWGGGGNPAIAWRIVGET